MTTTVGSVEELSNMALDLCRYPQVIGSIYEGTKAARIALRFYAQTRDELLMDDDWEFARQAATLALLKTAPVGGYGLTPWTSAYPPPPWIYEYAYPASCIEVRSVRPTPINIPPLRPRPWVFVLANDTVSGEKVILTNLANATAVYTGQVVDVTQWDSAFVETLIKRLAVKFAHAFAEADAVRDLLVEEAQAESEAEAHQG